jgi:cell division protein FtsW (lipid II flippase)
MTSNIGKIDAIVRYVLGIIFLALLFILDNPWRWLGLLGIVFIATAVINFCPVWRLIGVDTRERKPSTPQPH